MTVHEGWTAPEVPIQVPILEEKLTEALADVDRLEKSVQDKNDEIADLTARLAQEQGMIDHLQQELDNYRAGL